MRSCLRPLVIFCSSLLFSASFVVQAKEVISVYTTNGSTVHVNQNFRHGQRIEVPLGKLTNDATREGVIQINSLLNFNHHVIIGDGAGGDGNSSDNGDDNNPGRSPKKIGSGGKNVLGGSSAANEIAEEPLPEYCKDKEQINRFVHVITHIPHDGCPSGIDAKLVEGLNRRRACARMAPLTLSAKLSTEAASEALRMLPNVKGFKPARGSAVGYYWTSYWSNYASQINHRYFNLLAYWDDNNRGRPFIKSLDRYFSSKEWAGTKEIGVGCAGRFARNGVYNRGTLLMALFDLPSPTTTDSSGDDKHTPEDEVEDEDGDGVADPKRLPPYCAHEGEKLREIHSNISVPVTTCPADVLEQAIEGFAHQRVCAGLPRLVHTSDMAALATSWANNQSTNGLWYQPNMAAAGQYTIGKDAPQSARFIDLRDLDIFSKWDEWKGLPWYVPGGGAKDRFFTPEEWARTREFGVGCATYPYQKTNLFWLVAYFKHPGQATSLPGYCTDKSLKKMSLSATVSVPQKGCPPEIHSAAVEGFQKRRLCQGLPAMVHSDAAAAEATNWAADMAINDGYRHRYKPYGQFTSNSRVEWEGSGSQIAIKDFDIFEKWATWKELPWYTGDSRTGDRYFTSKEWADTKEFGVGCASLTKKGKNYFFLVAFFKYS